MICKVPPPLESVCTPLQFRVRHTPVLSLSTLFGEPAPWGADPLGSRSLELCFWGPNSYSDKAMAMRRHWAGGRLPGTVKMTRLLVRTAPVYQEPSKGLSRG